MRGIYLPSFVAIGWAVLILSLGLDKLLPASVAEWPWPKVTAMGAKQIFPHPYVSHVWLDEISFRGFPGKVKSVGRTAAAAEMVAAETGSDLPIAPLCQEY